MYKLCTMSMVNTNDLRIAFTILFQFSLVKSLNVISHRACQFGISDNAGGGQLIASEYIWNLSSPYLHATFVKISGIYLVTNQQKNTYKS